MKTLIQYTPIPVWIALLVLTLVAIVPQIGPLLVTEEVIVRQQTAQGCQEETWRVPTATVAKHDDDIHAAVKTFRAKGKTPVRSTICIDLPVIR